MSHLEKLSHFEVMISEMIKKWLEHVKINNLWSPLNQLSTFFKCDKILSKIFSSLTKFWKFFVTEASSALLHFSYFSYIDYFSYLNNNVLKKQNCSKKSEKSAQTLCKWVLYLNTPSWQYLKVPLKKVFSAMLNVTCFPDEKSKYQTDNYNCMVVTVVL